MNARAVLLATLFGAWIGFQAWSGSAADPRLITLMTNGPTALRINFVLVAEGYQSHEHAKFIEDAQVVIDGTFSSEPLETYRSYFNAFGIFVASAESGSDHPDRGVFHDTYFSSTYDSYGIQRLVTIPPNDLNRNFADGQGKLLDLLGLLVPEYDVPIVVVNDTEYGGSGGSALIVSTHSSSAEIASHEMGHTFGHLGDEYGTPFPEHPDTEEPNTTQEVMRNSLKWRYWILAETPLPTPAIPDFRDSIGLFEGAHYHEVGWYRPKLDCRMRQLGQPFCEVCKEAMVLSTYRLISPWDSVAPDNNQPVALETSREFRVDLVSIPRSNLGIDWTLNGVPLAPPVANRVVVDPSSLVPETNELVAWVHDRTSLVRNDPENLLERRISWKLVPKSTVPPIHPGVFVANSYLKASNPGISHRFSESMAASGDTVVIGAYGEAGKSTGVNGDESDQNAGRAGAAYVFVRKGSSWAQQAYLKANNTEAGDSFGYAVAISGDTIVIGAPADDSNSTGINGDAHNNGSSGSGAAHVFVRSGTEWTYQAYLKASNTGADDSFGSSVAISGDTVIIGAELEDSGAVGINGDSRDESASASGAAYLFVRSGTTWTQQAYLKASNTGMNDQFGLAVAIAGDTAVIGAWQEDSNATGVDGDEFSNDASDSGAAYVFARNGTTWTQQAYLKAHNTGASDNFGRSVSVSDDTVLIGAYREDSNSTKVNGDGFNNGASDSGAAYVFVRSGTSWAQQAYLKAGNGEARDNFGRSVAASGEVVVVGAPQEDSIATGVDGDGASNDAVDSGAAYVFVRSGSTWNPANYLKAENTDTGDVFGYSMALSGNVAIVGARGEASNAKGVNGDRNDNTMPGSGAAYVFTASGMGSAPVITRQPQNLNVQQGEDASFVVAVSGTGPFTYNWGLWCPPEDPAWPDCNCIPSSACFPNLTSLTISNATPSQARGYYVVITNSFGSVTSEVAILTVVGPVCVPPVITQFGYAGTTFILWFQSIAGLTYDIEYQNALIDPLSWNLLQSVGARGILTAVQDSITVGERRFYRVVCQGVLPTLPLTSIELLNPPP